MLRPKAAKCFALVSVPQSKGAILDNKNPLASCEIDDFAEIMRTAKAVLNNYGTRLWATTFP